MGQYYTPVLKDKKNNFEYYYSHEYDNGLKLMEHSYISNYFVESIVKRLLNNPMRVAWVGDYAEEEDFIKNPTHKDLIDFVNVERNNAIFKKGDFNPVKDMENSLNLFMINHTKKIFIDMSSYLASNIVSDKDKWNYGFCIHPLPLLTALGNEKGGGDYRGINKELVGTWAGDLIEFVSCETLYEKHKGYTKFNPQFREG